MVSAIQVAEMLSIFSGSEVGYGRHSYADSGDGEKESGSSWTERNKSVTAELWKKHLNGKEGIGIVPIRRDGMCKFTVIDVDVYDSDFSTFIEAIDRHNFPLVPFRSKSGGLHVYMILDDFAPAKDAIEVTRRIATILALDRFSKQKNNRMLEVFPKQESHKADSVGSWINMPYFNAEHTKQFAYGKGGAELSLDDALVLIRERMLPIRAVKDFLDNLPFADAPPCLQTIYMLNAVGKHGGRNNYLFSFGAYFKKKDETFFEQHLYDVNDSMKEPLSSNELEDTVISSLRKKDYMYMCSQPPCCDYCNKVECKLRTYGVGRNEGYFSDVEYGVLTQYKQDQPYYEWEVRQQGQEEWLILRFKNEADILKQDTFRQLCFRELHILPPQMNRGVWEKIIRDSLSSIKIVNIEEDFDTSPVVLLKALVYEFIKKRNLATSYEQMNKRAYYDYEKDLYCVRATDILDYIIINKNFRFYQTSELHAKLKDFGFTPVRHRVGGKHYRLLTITPDNLIGIGVGEARDVSEDEIANTEDNYENRRDELHEEEMNEKGFDSEY